MKASNADIWAHLAAMRGFNVLASEAQTIGERLMLRLLVDENEKWLTDHGCRVTRSPGNDVVLEIPFERISLKFRESDWELMRKALAEHDAKTEEP